MMRKIDLEIENCLQCPYFEKKDADNKYLLLCRHPYGKFESDNLEDIISWFKDLCPLSESSAIEFNVVESIDN